MTNARILMMLVTLSLACQGRQPMECNEIAGASSLFGAGNIVMLGELHGTEQAPAFLSELVCQATNTGLKVTVALELPDSEQSYADQYLASPGDLKAKVAFLSAPWWSQDYQDGRASSAMLNLIDDIRNLRQQGSDVQLMFMDNPGAGQARDEIMANRLLKAILSDPGRLYFALTGNLHNRLEGARMGWYIKEEISSDLVFSLNQHFPSGTAWVCLGGGGCGVHEMSGMGDGEIKIVLEQEYRAGAYSGYYSTKALTAALPAIRTLR